MCFLQINSTLFSLFIALFSALLSHINFDMLHSFLNLQHNIPGEDIHKHHPKTHNPSGEIFVYFLVSLCLATLHGEFFLGMFLTVFSWVAETATSMFPALTPTVPSLQPPHFL